MQGIQFTKEGRRFFIAVVLIGFASLSTGNNLIYLLFSMMISLSLIAFAIAFMNLRRLSCDIHLREPVYADSPIKIDITMKNRKFIPSYSISVVLPVGLSRELYVPVVKKGESRWSFPNVVISSRGMYLLGDVRLRTGFPFIFLYLTRRLAYNRELIVYPAIVDVSSFLRDMQSQFSERETIKKGQEGDFLFSREYVYGEESRNIDWKATAKVQKTMVKEYSKQDEQFITLILDNGGSAEESAFEKAVSVTASLCLEFIERGFYVRLMTCGKVVPFGSGRVHLFKMLDILAAIQEIKAPECPVEDSLEGMSILVTSSSLSSFSRIAPLCTGVIDARNL
jgi:uncharacterized protein (DUF58 family)